MFSLPMIDGALSTVVIKYIYCFGGAVGNQQARYRPAETNLTFELPSLSRS